jgi:hypothetical protein
MFADETKRKASNTFVQILDRSKHIRSPLADEPDLPIGLIQGIAAKAAPTGLFAFGDRDGRSDVLALRPGEGCNAGRKDDVHGAESGVFRNANSRASALLPREAISHR